MSGMGGLKGDIRRGDARGADLHAGRHGEVCGLLLNRAVEILYVGSIVS